MSTNEDSRSVAYKMWRRSIEENSESGAARALVLPAEVNNDECLSYPNVHFWMGINLLNLERYGEARESFIKALERLRKESALGGTIRDIVRQGHAVRRFSDFPLETQTGREKGMQSDLYHALGLAEFSLNNWGEAEKSYNEALKIAGDMEDPDLRAGIRSDLGWLYSRMGDLAKALKQYDEILKSPGSLEGYALIHKGLILYRMEDSRGAREAFDSAMRAVAGRPRAEKGGTGKDGMGMVDTGIVDTGMVDTEDSHAVSLLLARASILNNLGRMDLDDEDYEAARRRFEEANRIYAMAGAPWDDLAPRIRSIRRSNLAALFNNMGVLYYNLGFSDRARKEYESALNLGPSAKAYYNLGMLLAEEGSKARGKRMIRQALRCNPGLETARRYLVMTEEGAGRVSWWDWWFQRPEPRSPKGPARGIRARLWRPISGSIGWGLDNSRRVVGAVLVLGAVALVLDMVNHTVMNSDLYGPSINASSLNATAAASTTLSVVSYHAIVMGMILLLLVLPRIKSLSFGGSVRMEMEPESEGSSADPGEPLS